MLLFVSQQRSSCSDIVSHSITPSKIYCSSAVEFQGVPRISTYLLTSTRRSLFWVVTLHNEVVNTKSWTYTYTFNIQPVLSGQTTLEACRRTGVGLDGLLGCPVVTGVPLFPSQTVRYHKIGRQESLLVRRPDS